MVSQEHALRQLFHEMVSDCYNSRLGMHDPEIATYVADLLTEFCCVEKVYQVRDALGNSVCEVRGMLAAADPVHGTAESFDQERRIRKHIGDYALFFTGMYPDSMHLWQHRGRDSFFEMVHAGKESYYIVSQFDLFEYALEAPFFARLSNNFEECIYGLSLVRGELDRLKAVASPDARGEEPPSSARQHLM